MRGKLHIAIVASALIGLGAGYLVYQRKNWEDTKSRWKLGDVLIKQGYLIGGIGEFLKAGIGVQMDPAEHLLLGMSLLQQGDCAGAIKPLRESVRLEPEDADSHRLLGEALGCNRNLEGAVAELRAARRLRPDVVSYAALGRVLLEKGEVDEAVGQLGKAVELESTVSPYYHGYASFWLGAALEKKGRLDGALKQYAEARGLDPKNEEFRAAYERLARDIKR